MKRFGFVAWFQAGAAPAFLAAILAFQALASLSLPLLFGEPPGSAIQEPAAEGVPIPVGMYWGPATYRVVSSLARLSAVSVFVFQVGLYLAMLYCLIRVLNPSFRLTTGVDWDETILTKTYIHTVPLIKVFLIAVTAFVPLLGIYRLFAWLPVSQEISLAAGCVVTGAAVWFLFSRNGVAGDLDSGNYLLPRDRHEIASLLFRGALAGLAVLAIALSRPAEFGEEMIRLYRSLGYIGQTSWWSASFWITGFAALAAFAGSGLALALGAPERDANQRLCFGAAPALLLIFLLGARHLGMTRWAAVRYDYVPRAAASEAERLRQAAGISNQAATGRSILFLGRRGALPMEIISQTIDGLPATDETASRVRAFLGKRERMTALGDVAYRTLFDIACLSMEPGQLLGLCRERLARSPDAPWLGLYLEKLSFVQANSEAREHAANLADSRRFRVEDTQAELMLGDLLARLGDRNAAAVRYRRAGLTESGIAERAPEQTMFTGGTIRGILRLRGKAVERARVGVVLQGVLRQRRGMLVRPGVLRPFWLRTVSASSLTGADGSFALTDLIAGNYHLVVEIPEFRPAPLRPVPMTCTNGDISEVFVGFGKPKVYLGEIDLQPEDTLVARPSGLAPEAVR